MAAPTTVEKKPASASAPAAPAHRPYVPDSVAMPELTWSALLAGVILGILFGASSLYLVLKVGMTVSASIPVAVLSITLFRGLAKAFGLRPATILENNIVQTTGSAGESIAFGIGVTMPALLLLGLDMSLVRVMTVGVLGGLLGILMMIPLRRAFIVEQHDELRYPEGTACADVLIVGEQGGATAKTVFFGFGLAFLHKTLMKAMGLWKEDVAWELYTAKGQGLKRGVLGGELSPELLGVGYIIGPRIASIMMAGGVLAYLVLIPLIVFFGANLRAPLAPVTDKLIGDMSTADVRNFYVLYIGAGAVATGGIISMIQSLPMIVGSLVGAFRDMSAAKSSGKGKAGLPRTERDLPLSFIIIGSVALIVAMAASPSLGLGFSWFGLLGAVCILFFGFLFVTVSSRLTGEIGSSSNPISGMTVATLLLTCLAFMALKYTGPEATLVALSVAAVVCVAASNGGTTSQDLKTGYLVGATPRSQQLAILVGALTSALVIGGTLLLLNSSGTVYTKKGLPRVTIPNVEKLPLTEQPGSEYGDSTSKQFDASYYHVLNASEGQYRGVPAGKYLVDKSGRIVYYVDPAITGHVMARDDGTAVPNKFEAPKTRLMALIIDGILGNRLPWPLVLMGAMIAIVFELAGVSSLPFAVGVYLPIHVSTPIFIGGMLRWLVDKITRQADGDSESSPGVLLSSGYIAGGTLAGVAIAVWSFAPQNWIDAVNLAPRLSDGWNASDWPTLAAFVFLIIPLFLAGLGIGFRGGASKSRAANKSG